jgi:hypothetical protein
MTIRAEASMYMDLHACDSRSGCTTVFPEPGIVVELKTSNISFILPG